MTIGRSRKSKEKKSQSDKPATFRIYSQEELDKFIAADQLKPSTNK